MQRGLDLFLIDESAMKHFQTMAVAAMLALPTVTLAGPQRTGLTFQVELQQARGPANGSVDFQLGPFDHAEGGVSLTVPVVPECI